MPGWPRPEHPGDFLAVKYYDVPPGVGFFQVTTTSKLIGRLQVTDMVPGDLYELVYGPIGFWSWNNGAITEPDTQVQMSFHQRPVGAPPPGALVTRIHTFAYKGVSTLQTQMTVPTINTFFIASMNEAIFDCRIVLTVGASNQNICNLSRAIFGIKAVAQAGNFQAVTDFSQ